MRKMFAAVVVLGVLLNVVAQEQEDRLKVSLELTYASKYVAHGINIGDDEEVMQAGVFLKDVLTPGLEFFLWGSMPIDRDWIDPDEVDLVCRYMHFFNPQDRFGVNLRLAASYWRYPHYEISYNRDAKYIGKEDYNGFKFLAGFDLPNILPLGPTLVIPSYTMYYWTPLNDEMFWSGYAHELMLTWRMPLPVQDRQFLDLVTTMTYFDEPLYVDNGWSHNTLHLLTTFRFGSVNVTPALNYQWSHEDTVNTEDEFWVTLTVAKTF